MALRWDLKPLFKNAKPGTDADMWTRRSAISSTLAFTGLMVGTMSVHWWQFLIIAVAMVFAFDAGDMRFPFSDDDDPDADRPLTRRELLYRPESERDDEPYFYAGREHHNPER